MKIFPKSAYETKQDFFEKKRWTLHLALVYTHSQVGMNLQIHAFDHWSNDTCQDSWFTASSLHAVIVELNPKPEWITFILDNGPHYHNADLMIIMKDERNGIIYVRKWTYFETGEAKISIDSHYAQISHAIKCHICQGFDILQGSNIELAIEGICGTSAAHLKPKCTKALGKKK
ncbi:hypothetical protein RclHR1_08040004 [Rhizophagus clarus]|uniref:Uncharacterized protein n=1 Tax=Rhizophagus clarus TaxID=94130 RepID=A0A2Z6SEV4_9GLOM|nr:hypothetical protein RclHR1_08040004 [Rhizophagus clarus]